MSSLTAWHPIARHLASQGFLAVALEHPGSNLQKFKNLLAGSSKKVFDVSEFIDRPQDVSRQYLQSGYAISISQSPNQVSILRSLTAEQLDNVLQLEPPIAKSNIRSRD